MIYENNVKAIKNKYGDLFDFILSEYENKSMSGILIEQAKNGEPIIGINLDGQISYLNSKYNPTNEASRYIEEFQNMNDESVMTMFGMANMSFAREYLKVCKKHTYCIIIEPSTDIFMNVIRNIDISDVLLDERVILVVMDINYSLFQVTLSKLIQYHNEHGNKHIVLPKYAKLYPVELEKVVKTLNEAYSVLHAQATVIKEDGKLSCRNEVYNISYIPGSRLGTDYKKNIPDGMPVIVVAAGPSLDKNVDLLKELKNKALIVVVDTAIPRVMSRGIKPDIVVTVDYKKSIKHFANLLSEDSYFLIDSDSNTNVLDQVKPSNIIFTSSDTLLWQNIYREAGGKITELQLGGSVATAAIAAMLSWGFKKIILIGQDLAFAGDKVHAGDSGNTVASNTWATTYVEGINGEQLLTRADYCSYLRWIENVAYEHPEVMLIDATEGGALKKNTTIMTLKEAIDKYCQNEWDIAGILASAPRYYIDSENVLIDKLNAIKRSIRHLRNSMKSGAIDCENSVNMLNRGVINTKQLKKTLSNIGILDELYLESEERGLLARFIGMADVEFDEDLYEQEEDDIEETIRMFEKSAKYYRAIADAVPEIIKMIDECIERLNKI